MSEKIFIGSFTGLKTKRGHASKFWELDKEIRWLKNDLGHMIIRGNEKECSRIRNLIEEKMKEIRLISVG